MPKVSVVIPSYNHQAYIAQSVGSVLGQSLSDLELIVVDDGSRDDSVRILQEIHDPRFRLITQENRGAHAAINRGLELSTGDYCAILNSDDLYHPERLEKLIQWIESHPEIGIIGSYIEIIDATGKVGGIKQGYRNMEPWSLTHPERSFRAGSDLRSALLTENYLATTSNFVFRREWFERTGGFLPLRYTHDWDFALRVAKSGSIYLFPEALLQYRIHSTNTIRENHAAMIFEICWCLAVHLPQHVAEEAWYRSIPPGQRSAQLLHSIYTFGNEKVLSTLLIQGIYQNPQLALYLLDPQNASRQVFIDFIRQNIENTPPKDRKSIWRVLLQRVTGLIKK